jgi:hypothetical protein
MQLSNSCNAITCSRLSHVRGCDILHAQAKQCLQKISLLRTQLFPSQSLLLPYRQPGLQASALPNMNFTVALTTAIHYAHANPGTIAIATGSAAVVACPALLSVAAFSAAGLASNGPVAGDPPLPISILMIRSLIDVQVVHLHSYNPPSAERLHLRPYFKAQPWAGMVSPLSTEWYKLVGLSPGWRP